MPDDFLISAGAFAIEAVVLAALPFAPLALACRLINTLQDARTRWTPAIELVALAVGVAAGLVLLGRTIDPQLIAAGEIFRPGGPWDLDYAGFLDLWGNPLGYPLWVMAPGPGAGPAALLAAVLAVAVTLAPAIAFPTWRGIAAGLRNLVIVLWGAYVAVYGFCFVLWLLNKLNFWAFLLLLLVIHLARSRSEHVVVHLR